MNNKSCKHKEDEHICPDQMKKHVDALREQLVYWRTKAHKISLKWARFCGVEFAIIILLTIALIIK